MFDPANKAFLDAISNGECPHELLPEHPGTAINVNMVRKDTDYEPAAQPRHVAFTGKGRTLTGKSPSMHQQRGPRISSMAYRPGAILSPLASHFHAACLQYQGGCP